MSIISISDIELLPGVGTIDEAHIPTYLMLISSVQAEAEKITNRKFDIDDYDQVFDMDGSEVSLPQYPINSISTVSYGNPFSDIFSLSVKTNVIK